MDDTHHNDPQTIGKVVQNLRNALDHAKVTPAELSRRLGRSKDYIRDFLAGRKLSMGSGEVSRIEANLKLEPGSLYSDEFRFLHRVGPEEDAHAEPHDAAPDIQEEMFRARHRRLRPGEIPERNVVGGLGSGADGTVVMIDGQTTDEVRDVWRIPPEYIRTELSAREADLDIITVQGDSMQPTILPGDKVMINRAQGLSGDGIYAVHDGTGPSVKRLQVMIGTDPIRIRVLSDNPNHERYDVAATDLHIIGRVIWRGTRL